MSYFQSNRSLVNVRSGQDNPDDADFLREAQAGAVWAVASHFTVEKAAALVTMPTGSGKTAVMTLLPFLMNATRVLVIAPSVLVRDQVYDEFRTLATLKKAGTVPDGMPMPRVLRVTHRMSPLDKWPAPGDIDVVVATPHCVSPAYPEVVIPEDFFDLLLMDEGHHATAATWASVMTHSAAPKQVLFSATPFRRDRRIIPADQVYNYPLSLAIEHGIYQTIDYVPVDS